MRDYSIRVKSRIVTIDGGQRRVYRMTIYLGGEPVAQASVVSRESLARVFLKVLREDDK